MTQIDAPTTGRVSQARAGAGLGLAVVSGASFGTSGVFARSLIDAGWTAGAAVTVRVAVAAALLAIPAAVALRGQWSLVRASLGPVALFGLLAVACAQGAFFNAVRYLPVGIALLLEYSGILLVVLWMWAVHGQRPRRLTVAGAAVALVGLVFVLDVFGGGDIDPVGVVWGLGAAVGLASYFVLSGRIDPRLPAVALASGGMAVGAVALLLLGAVGLLPLHVTTNPVTLAQHRMSWLVPVIGVSLVAAVLSYVSGIGANRILGPSLASFVGLSEVLFAVLFAWLLLNQLPGLTQAAGGVLIVGGIVLVRLDDLKT